MDNTCTDNTPADNAVQPAPSSPATPPLPAVTLFNLEQFEWRVHTEETELACRELVFLLGELDRAYGQWSDRVRAYAPGQLSGTLNRHLCTRIAGAVTTLFSRPGFSISDTGYVQLMNLHRWLALIFAVSAYRHGDHIIRNLNAAGGGVVDPLTLNGGNLRLFCLCYFPDSEIALQPEVLWQYDRETVVRLFCALISGRALPSPAAHAKREQLLAWLPEKLTELDSLDFLPVAVLHDVYMHCSYADLPGKHLIKRELSRLAALKLNRELAQYLPVRAPARDREKPVVAVVLEHFTCRHSIYRTHSTSMRALREYFHLTGIAMPGATDELTREVFDDFTVLAADAPVGDAVRLLSERRPDIIYYPSVGMFPLTVFLTSLRLAPLQLMAPGHPATTWSAHIDAVLVEEDYLGDPACFSERVCALPKDALPYIPPAGTTRVLPARTAFRERRKAARPRALPVRIAVCASIMKINPGFLTALAEAEVNAHMEVGAYQQALNSCELFANPFPFGNTNGLVDTVRQGLPGVCMSGPEVHTHIDEGLFRRLGLPEELIAGDRETYIRAVVRLAEDDAWRESLQTQLRENDPEQVLFTGHPEKFAAAVKALWEESVSGREEGVP
ncbi:TPA: cobalt ABC transporter permease [Salmonella enterica subsp. enterica serovar Muenchen]|nr:cobalt ABC transporter permease [Salmonella enterica]